MPELRGKVALVTGASRGIGLAIAEALVDCGARVAIAARSKAGVERAAEQLGTRARVRAGHSAEPKDTGREAGAQSSNRGRVGEHANESSPVLGITCDVGRYEDCQRLVRETVDAFGRLDILVNNAGIGAYAHVEQMAVTEWDALIRTNLHSLFYCCHEAIAHLRRATGGWIINIGSLAGKNPFAGGAAYNASKFGLIGFSEALMQEVRHDGIRVSYIMPGSVATEFGGNDAAHGANWKILPEDIARIVTDLLDMPERTLPSRIEVRPSRPPKK